MSRRIFYFAVAVDVVAALIFPARVFTVSPICGAGMDIEPWICWPAVCFNVLAETMPAWRLICVRARDTLIAIAVYRVVYAC